MNVLDEPDKSARPSRHGGDDEFGGIPNPNGNLISSKSLRESASAPSRDRGVDSTFLTADELLPVKVSRQIGDENFFEFHQESGVNRWLLPSDVGMGQLHLPGGEIVKEPLHGHLAREFAGFLGHDAGLAVARAANIENTAFAFIDYGVGCQG